MIVVAVFALLALFSIISIVMSAEEPREYHDPRVDLPLWVLLGRR